MVGVADPESEVQERSTQDEEDEPPNPVGPVPKRSSPSLEVRELRQNINELKDQFRSMMDMMQTIADRTATERVPTAVPSIETSVQPTIRPISVRPIQLTPLSEPLPDVHPENAPELPLYKSKITERIDALGDGIDPTYRQWKISIRDRFSVNADHYPTPETQKALIWSLTKGKARKYLEPRYCSSDPRTEFHSYQEMMTVLENFFVSGYETEDARNEFMAMHMQDRHHPHEHFLDFKARFISQSLLGEIPDTELYNYMWDKITPQLRSSSATLKRGWNGSFNEMVADLVSLDKTKRRNAELNPSKQQPDRSQAVPVTTTKRTTSTISRSAPNTNYGKLATTPAGNSRGTLVLKDNPRLFNPNASLHASASTTSWKDKTEGRSSGPSAKSPCNICKSSTHWANECPQRPSVNEIEEEEDHEGPNSILDDAEDPPEDPEGNDDA